jgi:hypothetical protein
MPEKGIKSSDKIKMIGYASFKHRKMNVLAVLGELEPSLEQVSNLCSSSYLEFGPVKQEEHLSSIKGVYYPQFIEFTLRREHGSNNTASLIALSFHLENTENVIENIFDKSGFIIDSVGDRVAHAFERKIKKELEIEYTELKKGFVDSPDFEFEKYWSAIRYCTFLRDEKHYSAADASLKSARKLSIPKEFIKNLADYKVNLNIQEEF